MSKDSLHWVIQTNIYAEEGFESLIATIQRFELPYTLVKVVPFVGDLEVVKGELPPDNSRAIVMGSYSLTKAAKLRGWKPGAFLDNLNFEIQRQHWGERMLNYDAVITTFDNVPFQREPFFLRPVHDTKAFTGMVLDWGYYEDWRDYIRQLSISVDTSAGDSLPELLNKDTPVMVCSKKEIYSETRCWVVKQPPVTLGVDRRYSIPGGPKIVTASMYKLGTLKRYEEIRSSRWDSDIIKFAEDCATQWSPNDAYVLDIAQMSDGLKIIEINNINSAGWYKGDLQKLVHALESMV